jgi:uncharacterized surface protein with fasciclin (FAS1) repeats
MKKRNVILFIGIIVASIIGTKTFANPLENPNSNKINPEEIESIIKSIKDNPRFSIFYEAIEKSELSKEIEKLDNVTFMIPTNRAIKILPSDVWENFMDDENKDALVKLLSYHIIPERLNFDDLEKRNELTTLNNQSVNLSNYNELKIENAVIQKRQEESNKAIVYQLDRLIMPLN